MKQQKIIFWITTTLIFLFEGVMPALTSQTEMAKKGITDLGYPLYFGTALAVFKSIGALCLILPMIPKRIKEWAYAGFVFDFAFAAISIIAIHGFCVEALFPVIIFIVLLLSYLSYHKIEKLKNTL